MFKLINILLFLIIGIIISPNSAVACDKKEIAYKTSVNDSKSVKISCCNKKSKEIGRDCNKKCDDHQCECSITNHISYLNKQKYDEAIMFDHDIQKCFSIYKASFYNEVHISIWHPPKTV